MGVPRKPTNVLQAAGSFSKNPSRGKARANEPKVERALGKPPKYLTEEEQINAWNEIVDQCPTGVLTYADRLTVEMASRMVAEMRELGNEFQVTKLTRLQSVLASFGMTPADRSRVSVPVVEEDNEFGL